MFPFTTRVNNVFPSGAGSGSPDMAAGGINPAFVGQMINMIRNERMQAKNEASNQQAADKSDAIIRQNQMLAEQKYSGQPGSNAPKNTVFLGDSPVTQEGMTPLQEKEMGLRQQQIAAQYGFKGAQLAQGQEKIDLNRQLGEQKIGVSQQRADAYSALQDAKAKYQGSSIKAVKGGNFVVVKPDGTTVDTGIDTGTLSDQDLQDAKQQGVIDAIDERGAQQRQTDAAKPIKTTPTSGYSTQKLNMARANEFLNANPDMKNVVSIDPQNNMITINPESQGGMFSNPVTKDQRQKAYNWIYKGQGSAMTGATPQSTTPGGNPAPQTGNTTGGTVPTPPPGRVSIWRNGQYAGHIPQAQSDDAIKQGLSLTAPGGGKQDNDEDNE